jgi:hypothetical protein
MNKTNLLDNCLAILHSIKEDKESLEKLLEFMEEEFVSKTPVITSLPDCKLQIEEKYRPLVKDIAEYLGMGLIVLVNPETLEIDYMPQDDDDIDFDDYDEDKVMDCIKIEPLVSRESYQIMKSFVENLPEGKEKNKFSVTIEGHKPFANFNRLIHNSDERENWFKHRTYWLEKYVIDNYLSRIIN